MKKNNLIKFVGLIGFFIILVGASTIVAILFINSMHSHKSLESIVTAFAGAFFAYVLVKIGELFTRMSLREKLNADTLVSLQYTLNQHLNRIGTNLDISKSLIEAINNRSSIIKVIAFKNITYDITNLRDMKNLDYINDVFGYYNDIESINDGLHVIQSFAKFMIDNLNQPATNQSQEFNKQVGYAAQADALKEMMNTSIKLLHSVEEECLVLLAKNEYAMENRNQWLSIAIPWFNVSHYGKDLDDKLPKILVELKKSRDSNIARSKQKKKELKRELLGNKTD